MKNKSQMNLLNYRVIGDGHPVLFLHGFLESISMWNYLPLDDLNIQRIEIDLPGHGNSAYLTSETPTIADMAIEVVKIIKELNLSEFSIIGHSMGGYVALEVQSIEEKCKKVVLLNSNFWADSPEKMSDRKRIAEIVQTSKNLFLQEAIPNLFSVPSSYIEQISALLNEAKEMSPEAIAYASLAMANRKDFSIKVQEGLIDFAVIQGEIDRIVQMEKIDLEISIDVPYYKLPNTGHMSHIENPLGTMAILKEIFK